MVAGPSNQLTQPGVLEAPVRSLFATTRAIARSRWLPLAGAVPTSVVAFVFSQPPFDLWWLGPVCLLPWMTALVDGRPFVGAGTGFLIGSFSGAGMTPWIQGGLQNLGASATEAALGVGLTAMWGGGLHWAAIGVLLSLSLRMNGARRAAALFVGLLEIDWCSQLLPASLPWVLLGHSQWNAPGVAQLAATGGVPIVSGLLAAISGAAAGALQARSRAARRAELKCLVALVGAFLACLFWAEPAARWSRPVDRSPSDTLRLLVVQPNVPAGDRWAPTAQRTNLATIGRQTLEAMSRSAADADLIVWPETVLTQPVDQPGELQRDLLEWAARFGVPLILGAARSPSAGSAASYRNSALWLDPSAGVLDAIDKSRAIPVVEAASASLLTSATRSLVGLDALEDYAEEAPIEAPLGIDPTFAVTLCFESIFPALSDRRRDARTAALLNLANDSWFRSDVPSRQQIAFASFRAIEQRLPLLRVAHSGASVEIDPFGRIQQRLPFGQSGELWAVIDRHPVPPSALERSVPLAIALAGGLAGGCLFHLGTRRTSR